MHCQECDKGYALLLLDPNQTICGTLDTTTSECFINSTVYPNFIQSPQVSFEYKQSVGGSKPYCFNCQTYYQNENNPVESSCSECNPKKSDYLTESVYQYSEGCTSCSTIHPMQLEITYLPQAHLLMRECVSSSKDNQCTAVEFLNDQTQSCDKCTDKFNNCAACNSSVCLICADGFFWNPSVHDYNKGTSQGMCVYDACPLGYCKNMTKGHTQCVKSSDVHCDQCFELNSEQTCSGCSKGFSLSTSAESEQTCYGKKVHTSVDYFVTSGAPYLSNGDSPSEYLLTEGTDFENPTYFLAIALNKAELLLESYEKVTATIYLFKGDHYFFYCDDENSDDTTITSHLMDYCQNDLDPNTGIRMLHRRYRGSDNLQITLKAMRCENGYSLGLNTLNQFWHECSHLVIDPKPTIYVNSNNFYFNITAAASFQDLKFTGVNAFVASSQRFNPATKPFKYCYISNEPNGSDGELAVQSNQVRNFKLDFQCKDSWYTGSQLPQTANDDRSCLRNNKMTHSQKVTSTLSCPGDPSHEEFFHSSAEGFYYKRTKSLFVLSAFPQYQALHIEPPKLNITNCEFEYFYGGYESLIKIENNNFKKSTYNHTFPGNGGLEQQETLFYTFSGEDRGAKIWITGSSFKYSRFCRGMITYRKQPLIKSTFGFTNYTHLYQQSQSPQDEGSYIVIQDSEFQSLNSYSNVTALAAYEGSPVWQTLEASLEKLWYQQVIHKGIVLNIEDFGGNIEIANSEFYQNFHFIPEILLTRSLSREEVHLQKFKSLTKQVEEYQLAICDPLDQRDKYLFQEGVSSKDDIDKLFDTFERLSLIYVSRNRNVTLIRDSKFLANIGTFGGAITINSPNQGKRNTSYVIIQNNHFANNMAYFSGNAIYIRSTKKTSNINEICGGVHIQDNNFEKNIGLKFHNGGSISAVCQHIDNPQHEDFSSTSSIALDPETSENKTTFYSSVDKSLGFELFLIQFTLKGSVFTENYTGLKGSAIYLKNMNRVLISDCLFKSNGPVFSVKETEISPYVTYLSKRAITYFDETGTCGDEFEHLQNCALKENPIQWSQVQGAVYVEHCQESICLNSKYEASLQIVNSEFDNNQVGPIIDQSFGNNLASSIYIKGGFSNYLDNVTIHNHSGSFEQAISAKAHSLKEYFPPNYYNYSMSPALKIDISPQVADGTKDLVFRTLINRSTFFNNMNMQVQGLTVDQLYRGSLISYQSNYDKTKNNIQAKLAILNCDFDDNMFIGPQGSLLYVMKAQLEMKGSRFLNNGYLSKVIHTGDPTTARIKSLYTSYRLPFYQEFGIIYLEGDQELPDKGIHQFINNDFEYSFAQQGTIYTLQTSGQDVSFRDNTYRFTYAGKQGSIIYQMPAMIKYSVNLEREIIDYSFSQESGAISFTEANNLINLIITDSQFRNCYSAEGAALFLLKPSKVFVQSTMFTVDFQPQTNYELSEGRFKSKFSQSIHNYIEDDFLKDLTIGLKKPNSQVVIEEAYNDQDVTLGYETLLSGHSPFVDYIQIQECQFSNLQGDQTSAISVSSSKIRLFDRVGLSNAFFNNTHTSQGVIRLINNSLLDGFNLRIEKNTALTSSAVLYLSNSTASLTNTIIRGNSAVTYSMLTIENDSSFKCIGCEIKNNYAHESGILRAINSSPIAFTNTDFADNTVQSTLMTLVNSHVTFASTRFLNNIAQHTSSGITMVRSSVVADGITVSCSQMDVDDGNQVEYGFFQMYLESSLAISGGSVIKNCKGNIASVLFASGKNSILMDATSVNDTTGKSVVHLSMVEDVTLKNVNFAKTSHKTITMQSSTANITNSKFEDGRDSFIEAFDSSLYISNSTFTNGVSANGLGQGLSCSCDQLEISNCTFNNLLALEGGALFLSSSTLTSKFEVANSTFSNNQALQGGAIKIQDAIELKLESNLFINNSATEANKTQFQRSMQLQQGLGGAIFYDCQNRKLQLYNSCSVSLLGKNQFINNFAQNEGGAIKQTQGNTLKDVNATQYLDNTAAYSNNLSSYPKKLQIVFEQKDSNSDQSEQAGRGLQDSFPSIVSGEPFSFAIYVLDEYNEVYTRDSTSVAVLRPSQNSDPVRMVNNVASAVKGIFNFTDVEVTAHPGSEVSLNLEIKGLEFYQENLLQEPIKLLMITRECAEDEQLSSDNKCYKCQGRTYFQNQTCNVCPLEAICENGQLIGPKAGYQRNSNSSTTFFACLNPQVCLAADKSNPLGRCAEGYQGFLCTACDHGYEYSSNFQCYQCPDPQNNSARLFFALVISIAIVCIVVRSALASAEKQKPFFLVYLKIMINHFQIMGILLAVDFQWPHQLLVLEDIQVKIASYAEKIFSFECFQQPQDNGNQEIALFYKKLIFYGVLPFILIIVALFFWTLVALVKRDFRRLKNQLICTSVILIYLIYPNLATTMLTPFNCVELGNHYYLKSDTTERCFHGLHLILIVVISIPSLLIWCVCFPAFTLFLIKRHMRLLRQYESQVVQTKSDKHNLMTAKTRWGFLYSGFKIQFIFWEATALLKKLLLVMIIVLAEALSREVQVLMALLVVCASMMIHAKFQPYYSKVLNRLEILSLIVASVTLYGGMFYVTGAHYEYMDRVGLDWLILVCIIVPNFLFFAYWFYYIRVETLKFALIRSPKLFRMLSCGLQSVQKFEETHVFENNKKGATETVEVEEDPEDGESVEVQKKKARKAIQRMQMGQEGGTERKSLYSNSSDDIYNLERHFDKNDLVSDSYRDGKLKDSELKAQEIQLDFPSPMRRKVKNNNLDEMGYQSRYLKSSSNNLLQKNTTRTACKVYPEPDGPKQVNEIYKMPSSSLDTPCESENPQSLPRNQEYSPDQTSMPAQFQGISNLDRKTDKSSPEKSNYLARIMNVSDIKIEMQNIEATDNDQMATEQDEKLKQQEMVINQAQSSHDQPRRGNKRKNRFIQQQD